MINEKKYELWNVFKKNFLKLQYKSERLIQM